MKSKSLFEKEEPVKRCGIINEFLWTCAGVNKTVIRQCPTDYAKYAGIGGTILFTALMATLSGSYALYSVFYNLYAAIAFGIFWGLLIFNLDRFIVNTIYSDGKTTISWMELCSGMPRIIMAIFLGIVISTPLELKIFEDAIDIRIEQDKERLLNERISGSVHERDSIAQKRDEILSGARGVTMFDTNITTSSEETNKLLVEIRRLSKSINEIDAKIKKFDGQISELRKKLFQYEEGTTIYSNTLRRITSIKKSKKIESEKMAELRKQLSTKQGEAAASDETLKSLMSNKQTETTQEAKRLQLAVDSLNRTISEANTRHKDWNEKDIKERGSFRDKLDMEYKGFQAKMQAFDELKEENTATKISSWFIMLLFIIIETAPTFFKMMMEDGPYDFLLQAEKERVKMMAEDTVREFSDDLKTDKTISEDRNKERRNAEMDANKKIMDRISSIQMELLDEALIKWKSKELSKIDEDPSLYIKTSDL